MRKTKCKSCNGTARSEPWSMAHCKTCDGTGEISVYTIQELREGKVKTFSDGNFAELIKLVAIVFPEEKETLSNKDKFLFYNFQDNELWTASSMIDSPKPTQSVKIFLEEIEQEEAIGKIVHDEFVRAGSQMSQKIISEVMEREEPEFKWGEEVEGSDDGEKWFCGYKYGCRHIDGRHHVLFSNNNKITSDWEYVRKPQQITLTLSQIAEKFNVKKELIKIVE